MYFFIFIFYTIIYKIFFFFFLSLLLLLSNYHFKISRYIFFFCFYFQRAKVLNLADLTIFGYIHLSVFIIINKLKMYENSKYQNKDINYFLGYTVIFASNPLKTRNCYITIKQTIIIKFLFFIIKVSYFLNYNIY